MAIKLMVADPQAVNLNVNGDSTVSLKLGEAIIGVMPSPYSGSYTVTPTESVQTLETEGMSMSSDVTVDAISSTYVGSDIPLRSGTDLTANGATVSVPNGYYSESETKSVQIGSEGTPTATKSAVNNHSVTVTPSVTNAEGYISGGTHAGAAVSVSAADLVSGSQTVTSNQTIDATNLAEVVVDVNPSLQTKSVAPSLSAQTVSPDSGYYGLSEVSVSAMPTATWRGGSRIEPTISMAVDPTTGEVSASVNTSTAIMPLNGSGYADRITTYGVTVANGNTLQLDTQNGSTITPTTSEQTAVPSGTYTLGDVTVDPIPSQYIIPTGTKSITANGTGIDVTSYASVDVAVPGSSPNLQNKTKSYTPSETAQSETVSADAGYDGLGTVDVSVDAISSTYVGSGITRRDSTDLSASGATVSVPSGYYESNESKAIASGTAKPPTTISGSQATLSTGTNTITLQKTLNVTPQVSPGYIASGTQDSVLVSLNASVPTQAAQTLYPSSSDQTIQSGRYLTGNQTVKAVAVSSNLIASNIKDGVTVTVGDSADPDRILSVTGTYTGGGGGSVQFDTKTETASNYPVSLSFSQMKGESKAFVVRLNAQVSSSGSTTYYYIVDISHFGTTTHGNCFRIGSTRRVDNITSGYSWSYSNSTLTITSSASSRSASPGAFYSGSYELLYCY